MPGEIATCTARRLVRSWFGGSFAHAQYVTWRTPWGDARLADGFDLKEAPTLRKNFPVGLGAGGPGPCGSDSQLGAGLAALVKAHLVADRTGSLRSPARASAPGRRGRRGL